MAVTRFEDLVVWQRARVLTREMYAASKLESFRFDAALASQMQRAAVSIMANIAEGFARNRPAEFHRYLDIAYASCIELMSHLYVAVDSSAMTQSTHDGLRASADEVARMLLALKRNTAPGAMQPSRTAYRAPRTGGG
jgi:four helix bundle protein